MVGLKFKVFVSFFFLVLLSGCSPGGVASAQAVNQDFSLDLELYPEDVIIEGEEFSMDLILTNLGDYKLSRSNLAASEVNIGGLSSRNIEGGFTGTFNLLTNGVTELEPGDSIEKTLIEDKEYIRAIPESGEKTLEITLKYPYKKKITGTYCLSGEEDGVCQGGQTTYQKTPGSIGVNINSQKKTDETIFTIKIYNQGNGKVTGNRIETDINFGIPFDNRERSNTATCKTLSNGEGTIRLKTETQEKTITCTLIHEEDQTYQKEFTINLNYNYEQKYTKKIYFLNENEYDPNKYNNQRTSPTTDTPATPPAEPVNAGDETPPATTATSTIASTETENFAYIISNSIDESVCGTRTIESCIKHIAGDDEHSIIFISSNQAIKTRQMRLNGGNDNELSKDSREIFETIDDLGGDRIILASSRSGEGDWCDSLICETSEIREILRERDCEPNFAFIDIGLSESNRVQIGGTAEFIASNLENVCDNENDQSKHIRKLAKRLLDNTNTVAIYYPPENS